MADWIGVDVVEPTWRVSDLPRCYARRIRIDPDTGCWIYGKGIPNHYGTITVDGRQRPAHRVTYELLVGPISDGLVLDHVAARGCLGYRCVNPAHLEAVTPGENSRRNGVHRKVSANAADIPLPPVEVGEVPAVIVPELPSVVAGGSGWPAGRLSAADVLAEIFASI